MTTRYWHNQTPTDPSIHAMGNGELLAYGEGPDIVQLYGPPYSSPNILQMRTCCEAPLGDEAEREAHTAIWRHRLACDGELMLTFTECVASDLPVYIRQFTCSKAGVRFELHPHEGATFFSNPAHPRIWQQVILPGQRIFNYPATGTAFHWIIADGACTVTPADDGTLHIACAPGDGYLAIIGADDYPLGALYVERMQREGPAEIFTATRRYWEDFTRRRLAACPPAVTTAPADRLDAMDSVAVLMKTQQASDGGVMAGHRYPMAYIRDQYGMARGLLSLGMFEEAKQNLRFRLHKFSTFGTLHTAETMGTDCARHRHENDEVEGPAYTILQVRDYLAATGDEALAGEMWPMLAWCWQVQQRHLANGLLPFNGDETYVAGGFFPRSGLLQGSADSTLVFIEAGLWLAAWAEGHDRWTPAYAHRQRAIVEEARAAYRQWFVDGEKIWANAPERRGMIPDPRFRTGVCEGRCNGGFGWTERNAHGRYVCQHCLSRTDILAESPARLEVNSVALLPAYLGSDIVSSHELSTIIAHTLAQANAAGHIPSVPGMDGCVGYDPGLLLFAMLAVRHPETEHTVTRLLAMLDSAGAWNEYYGNDDHSHPWCCRARPWESGVNIAALVGYLQLKT